MTSLCCSMPEEGCLRTSGPWATHTGAETSPLWHGAAPSNSMSTGVSPTMSLSLCLLCFSSSVCYPQCSKHLSSYIFLHVSSCSLTRLLPLVAATFLNTFEQRHHMLLNWWKFWCTTGRFHLFQSCLETVGPALGRSWPPPKQGTLQPPAA